MELERCTPYIGIPTVCMYGTYLRYKYGKVYSPVWFPGVAARADLAAFNTADGLYLVRAHEHNDCLLSHNPSWSGLKLRFSADLLASFECPRWRPRRICEGWISVHDADFCRVGMAALLLTWTLRVQLSPMLIRPSRRVMLICLVWVLALFIYSCGVI